MFRVSSFELKDGRRMTVTLSVILLLPLA